jgi:hypothetical protein
MLPWRTAYRHHLSRQLPGRLGGQLERLNATRQFPAGIYLGESSLTNQDIDDFLFSQLKNIAGTIKDGTSFMSTQFITQKGIMCALNRRENLLARWQMQFTTIELGVFVPDGHCLNAVAPLTTNEQTTH